MNYFLNYLITQINLFNKQNNSVVKHDKTYSFTYKTTRASVTMYIVHNCTSLIYLQLHHARRNLNLAFRFMKNEFLYLSCNR